MKIDFDFSSVPFRRELNRYDLVRMRIPNRYWGARFEYISDTIVKTTGRSAKDVVKTYIDNMNEMRRSGFGFVLYGTNGSGKSSASVVIAKEFRRRGSTVLFMEASDLKRMVIEKEYFDSDEGITFWDRSKSVDVLVLDDFGKGIQDSTGFGASIFDELIRARNSRKLVTIITANLPINDWKKELGLQKSTMSSLKECTCPVEISGKDLRGSVASKLKNLFS